MYASLYIHIPCIHCSNTSTGMCIPTPTCTNVLYIMYMYQRMFTIILLAPNTCYGDHLYVMYSTCVQCTVHVYNVHVHARGYVTWSVYVSTDAITTNSWWQCTLSPHQLDGATTALVQWLVYVCMIKSIIFFYNSCLFKERWPGLVKRLLFSCIEGWFLRLW